MKWYEISPKDAVDLDLMSLASDHIEGPLNENGDECPWPWEPEQLVGAPIGQYHCPYCGAMVMAGVRHLDYRVDPDVAAKENKKNAEVDRGEPL